ncbi:hypothetical protein [Phycicoccus sp.]|uniref:hypothetical protein n=1 Tax=Phycicoccus sp. TaxID=1902410 RepID=UPI002BF0197A|nr:hypothetical protein [Phycicoccus sp.]HMM95364.1 hypothetical protein [Phycicoccus sp.]
MTFRRATLPTSDEGPATKIVVEHILSRHAMVVALASAKGYLADDDARGNRPSKRECEAAIREILWESGRDFRQRLVIEHDVDARMAWAEDLVMTHFATVFEGGA